MEPILHKIARLVGVPVDQLTAALRRCPPEICMVFGVEPEMVNECNMAAAPLGEVRALEHVSAFLSTFDEATRENFTDGEQKMAWEILHVAVAYHANGMF